MPRQETGENPEKETSEQKKMSEELQKMAFEAEYGAGTPSSKQEADAVKTAQAEQKELQENQPAWETIKRLQKESKDIKRSNETEANCTIEIEGKKYTIETIERGDDPKLRDVQKLFERTFGKEEVDPEEILRNAVDGHTASGQPDNKYRIMTVWNEKGKLVSAFTGGQLEMMDENGKATGESVYSVGYAVTDKRNRRKGLAEQAYISALIDATKEAQSEGNTLKMAIGECTYTSEKYWNRIGWKRMYGKSEDGKTLTELKYTQPALDFDTETGKPTEDAGEAPEHLMVDSFGTGEPSKEYITRAYQAVVHYNADWPKEEFDNPAAFKTHVEYMDNLRANFINPLREGGDLVFMNAKARAEAKKNGINVMGHDAADHGEAGKEDF